MGPRRKRQPWGPSFYHSSLPVAVASFLLLSSCPDGATAFLSTPLVTTPVYSYGLSSSFSHNPNNYLNFLGGPGPCYSLSTHVEALSAPPVEAEDNRPDPWTYLLSELTRKEDGEGAEDDDPCPRAPKKPQDKMEVPLMTGRRRLDPSVKVMEVSQQIKVYWPQVNRQTSHLSAADRALVRLALEVSCLAHLDQKRRSGKPFVEHPVAVAEIVAEMGMDGETIAAALLHDSVEDTALTLEDVERLFGTGVMNIVAGETKVSKLTKLGSRNRRPLPTPFASPSIVQSNNYPGFSNFDYEDGQTAENLRNLFLSSADDYRVILVKLADRLHNCRTLNFMPRHKQLRIARETLDIYAPLADRLGLRTVKTELEELGFKYGYPEQYQEISGNFCNKWSEYARVLTQARDELVEKLDTKWWLPPLTPNVTVSCRLKEKYSLWRKLERRRLEENAAVQLDDVQDVLGLRVIVSIDRLEGEDMESWRQKGVFLCYRLNSLIKQELSEPGFECEEEDYISAPKANNYQSLHTIIKYQGQLIEVQIRTAWMHSVAERGIASHWLYKDQQSVGPVRNRAIYSTWMNVLQQWEKEVMSGQEFIMAVRRELLGRQISFFLKREAAPVMDMPRGSTVLDVAFRVGLGHQLAQAEVNGLPAPLDYQVQNADVLALLSATDASPRPEWVMSANLMETRSKIRHYFRSRDSKLAEDRGRQVLWRLIEANRALLEKATMKDLPSESRLDHLVQERTPFLSLQDVYRNVSLSRDAASDAVGVICKALGLPKAVAVGLDTDSIMDISQGMGGASLDALAAARWVQRSKDGVAQFRRVNEEGDKVEVWRLCPHCLPLPGDTNLVAIEQRRVNGSLGRAVHQAACSVIRNNDVVVMEQLDLASLAAPDLVFSFPVEVEVKGSIIGTDRTAYYVMSSAHQCLAAMPHITIADLRAKLDRNNNVITASFLLRVHNKAEVDGLMAQLIKIDGVQEVRRKVLVLSPKAPVVLALPKPVSSTSGTTTTTTSTSRTGAGVPTTKS